MTKKRELEKILKRYGFKYEGGTKHELYVHPDGRHTRVKRHRELEDEYAEGVLKQAGIDPSCLKGRKRK